jgi:hypothetical protein
MKSVMVVVFVLLIGITAVGFYRGWFRLSTNSKVDATSATITVDKDKIRADEQQAKDKVEALGKSGN